MKAQENPASRLGYRHFAGAQHVRGSGEQLFTRVLRAALCCRQSRKTGNVDVTAAQDGTDSLAAQVERSAKECSERGCAAGFEHEFQALERETHRID